MFKSRIFNNLMVYLDPTISKILIYYFSYANQSIQPNLKLINLLFLI